MDVLWLKRNRPSLPRGSSLRAWVARTGAVDRVPCRSAERISSRCCDVRLEGISSEEEEEGEENDAWKRGKSVGEGWWAGVSRALLESKREEARRMPRHALRKLTEPRCRSFVSALPSILFAFRSCGTVACPRSVSPAKVTCSRVYFSFNFSFFFLYGLKGV